MKKLALSLLSATVLLSSSAFAVSTNSQNNQPKPPQHDAKFHQAMSECMSSAGIQKPSEPPKGEKPTQNNNQNSDRPAPPPSDNNSQSKGQKPPKHNMTDAQRQQVDSCMSSKGFKKPEGNPPQKPAN